MDAVPRTCARSTTHHQAELDTFLDILLSANLDLWALKSVWSGIRSIWEIKPQRGTTMQRCGQKIQ